MSSLRCLSLLAFGEKNIFDKPLWSYSLGIYWPDYVYTRAHVTFPFVRSFEPS